MTADPLHEWDFASEDNRGFHEAAELFPEMSQEEFDAFTKDIAENGLQTAIVTLPDGRIIDGRHRWRACMVTRTPPRYQVHNGNPWAYVVSANLHRRQLSDQQRAMVAERLAKRGPGERGPDRATIMKGAAAAVAFRDRQPSRAEAAGMLNVNDAAIERARRIRTRGITDLAPLVEENLIPLGTAARIASMDEGTQRKYVERIRNGEKPRDISRTAKEESRTAVTVFTKLQADNLSSGLIGIELAFKDVARVDSAITPNTARNLGVQIKSTKTVLNRLQKLLHDVAEKG